MAVTATPSCAPDSTLCGLLSVGVLYIWRRWACFRLAFPMEKIRRAPRMRSHIFVHRG
jgi:hypothetical protein